jgi:hypothetical protein
VNRRFRSRVRWALVRSTPALGTLSRLACRIGARQVARELLRIPGVEAVYARHGGPWSTSFLPGASDLDLSIVLDNLSADTPAHVHSVSERARDLSRLHFYVEAADVRVVARRELRGTWLPAEFLGRVEDWRLLGGEEVREGDGEELPPERIPTHPEFNKWWSNHLQVDLFARREGPEARWLRPTFRGALKSQMALRAARGAPVPRQEGYLEDDLVRDVEDAELKGRLLALRRRRFWASEARTEKVAILHATLRTVADFFRSLPAPEPDGGAWEPPPAERSAAAAGFRSRIEAEPRLARALSGAVAWPFPQVRPEYVRIDLVLKDGVRPAELAGAVDGMEAAFGGRTFDVGGGVRGELVLVPEAAFEHPLFHLGSEHPFQRARVQAAGVPCFGAPRLAAPAGEDRLERLRLYLAWHRFNLIRRPEAACRTLHPEQLAAIRGWLETGDESAGPDWQPEGRATDEAFLRLLHDYAEVEAALEGEHAGAV